MARPAHRRSTAIALCVAALTGGPAPARADVFDLTLSRFVRAPTGGAAADPSTDTAALAGYRQLLSELGVGLAPRLLSPADTIGYSGVQFEIDYGFTTISNKACASGGTAEAPANQDQCPWQFGVEGGRDGAGKRTPPPDMLQTLSLTVRKGIWLPLPSFEIGAGATKLLGSSLYAVSAYAKLALHEGFHDLAIPSIALRGSALRVLGESQIDLTLVQVDATLSKSFGIAGTVTLVPYLGAAWLYIIPRGQVLDVTPAHDAFRDGPNAPDLNANAVFPPSANENISRWRLFAGLRLRYQVLVLTTDFIATACGDFDGSCPATGQHKGVAVPDNSPWQFSWNLAAGALF